MTTFEFELPGLPERLVTQTAPDKLTLTSTGPAKPALKVRNGVLLPGANSWTSLSKRFATYKLPMLSTVSPTGLMPVGIERIGFTTIGEVVPLGLTAGAAAGA